MPNGRGQVFHLTHHHIGGAGFCHTLGGVGGRAPRRTRRANR
ncbi:hypothetical protein [Vibrio sp. vnigr-6D03]|nr:hypothetical protein [Vibrio sp. vnigr-6D03]